MQYYQLTDTLRSGQIIRQDGRRHYRFVFGSFQWERTTLFQAYLTEGTPLFRQYHPVTEEQAMAQLTQYGKQLAKSLEKAEAIARRAHAGQVDKAGQPYIQHPMTVAENLPDWDEKIVAWLHDVCEDTPITLEDLAREGIPHYLCKAVDLLTKREGQPYEAYLRNLRQNRIARNVKLMDLSHNMDITRIPNPTEKDYLRLEKYKKARQYLYGDISEWALDNDPEGDNAPQKALIPAMEIYRQIAPRALGGRKIPHGVSNPVVRQVDGQLYLAFFVYTYTRQELDQGAIRRPVSWILADFINGRFLREIPCTQEDFSRAGAGERYSTHNPNGAPTQELFRQAYAMLDAVRQDYAAHCQLNTQAYEAYLEAVLQAVPPAYHRFYRELSITPENQI